MCLILFIRKLTKKYPVINLFFKKLNGIFAMSKEIRDLINSIKSGQVENKILPEVKQETVSETVPSSVETNVEKTKKTVQLKTGKKEKPEIKHVKEKIKTETVQASEPKRAQKSTLLSEDFFASLSEIDFSFEQKSVSNIDDRIYEIFMLLKRKKRVKNIAVIINTILNNYIEENKEQIKMILLDNQL